MSIVVEIPRRTQIGWIFDRLRDEAVVQFDFVVSTDRTLFRNLLNAYRVKVFERVEKNALIVRLSEPWPVTEPLGRHAQKRRALQRPVEQVRIELAGDAFHDKSYLGALVSTKNPRMKRERRKP